MGQDAQPPVAATKAYNFFVSAVTSDQPWAEWIGKQLKEAGYTTFVEAWDMRPGHNLALSLNDALTTSERVLLVCSSRTPQTNLTQPQWASAFQRDPTGVGRRLIPVRVENCSLTGLLAALAPLNLVDLTEAEARTRLLDGVNDGRAIPPAAPYPGQQQPSHSSIPFPATLPAIWNVPYPRNPFFTGREDDLRTLASLLHTGQSAAIAQAISGLGGIGKTQLALEYAYRHRADYTAVLWASADTTETLTASYNAIAMLLDLPEKDAQDQSLMVQAVERWLQTHQDYLLILDNADDLALAQAFLPSSLSGHLLLTTRAHALGRLAHRLDLAKLDEDEGSRFVLHRSGILPAHEPLEHASPANQTAARVLVQEMGGLPLALDQAAAYIEETGCGLPGYLAIYRTHSAGLLRLRGGQIADHPEPVATTWHLSFQRVEQANSAAADLLRLCAFLASDAIPETLLFGDTSVLPATLRQCATDPLAANDALATLQRYSLITRHPVSHTLDIHRLVQTIIRTSFPEQEQRTLAERAVAVANQHFPCPEVATWDICQRLLPHAQVCAGWISRWQLASIEASRLLHNMGSYLNGRAAYHEAQGYLEQALEIKRAVLGEQHPDTAGSLNNLAGVYWSQGKYIEAEATSQQALAIKRAVLGEQHPSTASSLNNLAVVYRAQGKYAEAEAASQQALAIQRAVLGEQHPDTAGSLEGLANVYSSQSKHAEAEALYRQALTVYQTVLGEVHPDTARCCYNLALLYRAQGNAEQALPLFEQTFAVWHTILGADHQDTRDAWGAVEQTRHVLEKAKKHQNAWFPRILRKRTNHQ